VVRRSCSPWLRGGWCAPPGGSRAGESIRCNLTSCWSRARKDLGCVPGRRRRHGGWFIALLILKENVEKQRGGGVFAPQAIEGLRRLNALATQPEQRPRDGSRLQPAGGGAAPPAAGLEPITAGAVAVARSTALFSTGFLRRWPPMPISGFRRCAFSPPGPARRIPRLLRASHRRESRSGECGRQLISVDWQGGFYAATSTASSWPARRGPPTARFSLFAARSAVIRSGGRPCFGCSARQRLSLRRCAGGMIRRMLLLAGRRPSGGPCSLRWTLTSVSSSLEACVRPGLVADLAGCSPLLAALILRG